MADVLLANRAYPSSTNSFFASWLMTRAMKKAGWGVICHSDGVTKTAAGNNGNDSWGNAGDPAADTYPAGLSTHAAWIVLDRISMVVVDIHAAPTPGAGGLPKPGDKLTQASSGAEGELSGYIFDPVSSTGQVCIIPRVGTFDNAGAIVGTVSGASFAGAGAGCAFMHQQVCVWKLAGDTVTFSISYQAIDPGAGDVSFATLAALASCTATIAPGGANATTNAPTARQMMVRGTQGVTPAELGLFDSANFVANCQAMAANAIGSAGISPDGSFAISATNNAVADTQAVLAFLRCEDGEPGDRDPFVWITNTGVAPSVYDGSAATSAIGSVYMTFSQLTNMLGTSCVGYTNRLNGDERKASFYCQPYFGPSSVPMVSSGYPTQQVMLNTPALIPPIPREKPSLFTDNAGHCTTKGRPRRLAFYQKGLVGNLADGGLWFVCAAATSATVPAVALQLWDGSTSPAL